MCNGGRVFSCPVARLQSSSIGERQMRWLCKRQLHVAVVITFSIITCGAVIKAQNRSLEFSSDDLVRRALASNGELAAARIEIQRQRGRLRQAGLRPNPTLDVEQTTGRF